MKILLGFVDIDIYLLKIIYFLIFLSTSLTLKHYKVWWIKQNKILYIRFWENKEAGSDVFLKSKKNLLIKKLVDT